MDTTFASDAPRKLSIADAFGKAFERTGRVLFRPFDLKKWFVLGFAAFLGHLGEGGGGGNAFGNWGGGGGSGSSSSGSAGTDEFEQWLMNNLGLVIGIGVATLIFSMSIGLLVAWLHARGRFIFIDGVVRNRGAIVEPWKEYRVEGNSVFLFNVVIMLIAFPVMLGTAIAVIVGIWPDIRQGQMGGGSIATIVIGGVIMLVAGFIIATIGALLRNFVMPTMYLGRVRVREGWSIAWDELIRPHKGAITLYLLMRILLGVAVHIAATLITCLTCCVAAIPYIGTVILLPIYVFMQAFALHFIEQFGPDWKVFIYDPPPPSMASSPGVPPYEPSDGPLDDFGDDDPPPPPPSPDDPNR